MSETEFQTGEELLSKNPTIKSIDQVLDYIEQDIENPEKKEGLEHLLNVHTLLTRLKVKQIENHGSDKTPGDSLFVYSYMVTNSLNIVFGNWDCFTEIVDNHVILYNDLVYMDINSEEGYIQCILSFHYKVEPIIVGEVVNTLKSIFGGGLHISSEPFAVDQATKQYLWGKDEITQYLKNIRGVRVEPIVYFEDSTIGNC